MSAGDFEFAGRRVEPGKRRKLRLAVSQTYSGASVSIPVMVWRGKDDGPTVFVTGAIHGDELNGAGIIRELIMGKPFKLMSGTLILVPVVNIFGFERSSRYLPDRRDLNRCFPGSAEGSLASRLASRVFDEIVRRSDCGIDLHTGAVRRTNYPNIRADLSDDRVSDLARSFGTELVINGRGPQGSLRRAACAAGVPTVILEAGEVWKIEPGVVEVGVRGIKNVLISKGMVEGEPARPRYQVTVERTRWIRAQVGGLLQFHVAPGDTVEAGQPLATNSSLLGRERNVIEAPQRAVVLGMTTLPAAAPGDPVCHLALIDEDETRPERRSDALHERLREDLATSVSVRERDDPDEGDSDDQPEGR